MDIFPLLFILFCLFIALFMMHVLANDDFVLLRRYVSMTNLFDIAFMAFFIGLFFARVLYVIFHFSSGFLNPLVFFLFPYFPGLSLSGGIVGVVVFLFFYSNFLKLPKERIYDIFSVSFFSTLPVGLFILMAIGKKTFTVLLAEGILIIVSFVLFLIIIRLFHKGGSMKDGSISYLSLGIFSLISFLVEFLISNERFIFFLSKDQIALFCLFIFFTSVFIWQEYVSFRKKI